MLHNLHIMKVYAQTLRRSHFMDLASLIKYSSVRHFTFTSRVIFTNFANFKNKIQSVYENYNIYIHVKGLKTTTTGLSVADDDVLFDKRNIHLTNQKNHQKKGPIYKEELGPDATIVYIADPSYIRKIFSAGIKMFYQNTKYIISVVF